MKNKVISITAALALCATMLPMSAFALTEGAPKLSSASIAGNSSVSDSTGNLYLMVPSSLALAGQPFSMATSEAVEFVQTNVVNTEDGELYASSVSTDGSATLNFSIDLSNSDIGSDIDFNDAAYSISVSSSDGINWSGSFNSGFNATMNILASALNMSTATLRAGTMKDSSDVGNDTWKIYANSDAANTQLVICDPDATLVTVTYHFGDSSSYIFTLPSGAPLPTVTVPSTESVASWHTDSAYTSAPVVAGTAVTSNTDLYGKPAESGEAPTDGAFMTAFIAEASVLPINTADDWADFVDNAGDITSNQRVELNTDINCGGASYAALDFAGDFDGNSHTISNATFTANNGNAGLFAVIGEGQVVANLTLNNVSTGYATYSGALAGQVYGNAETSRETCLIQNVHVVGGTISGRTAAAVVGLSLGSTIRYCSSENTGISGVVNGAGIVGLTYGDVDSCFSKINNPFALQSRGGIAGKILEGGKVSNCLYAYSALRGENNSGTEVHNLRVTSSVEYYDLADWVGNQTCWALDETETTNDYGFNLEVTEYVFQSQS